MTHRLLRSAPMKTRDLHNEAGTLTGFEVSNLFLSRRRACRIAEGVRGSVVSASAGRLVESHDAFCAFTVDGAQFLVIEPFGDNSCYWIVAEKPHPTFRPLIERVRDAFEAASRWVDARARINRPAAVNEVGDCELHLASNPQSSRMPFCVAACRAFALEPGDLAVANRSCSLPSHRYALSDNERLIAGTVSAQPVPN
jgi:hypothetical protein